MIYSRIAVLAAALFLAGCTTNQLEKIQAATNNYRQSVAAINASIAESAPIVAKTCGDAQTIAMLIAPFAAQAKGDAPAVFAATNAGLVSYCQNIPSDIASTAAAIGKVYADAKAAYNRVKGK